ncbi:hypothetical protein BpHYR1_039948 [Brachionus plicatilis]|uniref:Uncharacterized protein n=1 Tax=Brachionus plicatilis TaxID=10195 RepID=A0A3M7PAQ4_BRAPC|nr:hypothetical protein BpHYR1_039948 [Brachionus plicatilis]
MSGVLESQISAVHHLGQVGKVLAIARPERGLFESVHQIRPAVFVHLPASAHRVGRSPLPTTRLGRIGRLGLGPQQNRLLSVQLHKTLAERQIVSNGTFPARVLIVSVVGKLALDPLVNFSDWQGFLLGLFQSHENETAERDAGFLVVLEHGERHGDKDEQEEDEDTEEGESGALSKCSLRLSVFEWMRPRVALGSAIDVGARTLMLSVSHESSVRSDSASAPTGIFSNCIWLSLIMFARLILFALILAHLN